MTDRWIVIPKWDEFQHRDAARANVPTWIKNMTQQLSKEEYLELTWQQRGLLHDIRLEYARSKRQLRDSTTTLSRRLGQRVTRSQLEALNHAGFIQFSASKPASSDASDPAGSEEKREEKKRQDQKQDQNPANAIASLSAGAPNGHDLAPIAAALTTTLAAAVHAGTTSDDPHKTEPGDIQWDQ